MSWTTAAALAAILCTLFFCVTIGFIVWVLRRPSIRIADYQQFGFVHGFNRDHLIALIRDTHVECNHACDHDCSRLNLRVTQLEQLVEQHRENNAASAATIDRRIGDLQLRHHDRLLQLEEDNVRLSNRIWALRKTRIRTATRFDYIGFVIGLVIGLIADIVVYMRDAQIFKTGYDLDYVGGDPVITDVIVNHWYLLIGIPFVTSIWGYFLGKIVRHVFGRDEQITAVPTHEDDEFKTDPYGTANYDGIDPYANTPRHARA